MKHQETDAERFRGAPVRAFEWVAQELDMPSDTARLVLREAFLAVAHEGYLKAIRALESAWPPEARWPSGETYLRKLGWRPECEIGVEENSEYDGPDLLELLHGRLTHVTHRMYRDAQVWALISPMSPTKRAKYTAVILNRDGLYTKRQDPCGIGRNKRYSLDEGLAMLSAPAHGHPACRCRIDPYPA